ncbi:hypothetical protein O181_121741 [Austropuccinia psidii MF-1]|uniref:Uncharacterized protein n=1 Tax=Austropuccinia psidii MF-1 TaxID=1389203 RepID=A0A9Q3KKY8_9BASI|nr:hypothetical protein [Austropuccinia psidii MF-1]
MLQMRILTLVQVSDSSNNCLGQGRLPMLHTQIITLVQAPDNSNNSLRLPCKSLRCAGSRQFKQFLIPGKASNNSHPNPYACAGSDNANNSLRLCRLPTIQTRILMLVKVPNNSNNSLCWGRLPISHMPILMLVQVPTILKILYACGGFQQFTCKSLRL